MLFELKQLLSCRRERESRAAAALRQVRFRLNQAKAEAEAAREKLDEHHQDRKKRQDKLYRRSERSLLTKQAIDDLNIELDLMGEETDALVKDVEEAEARVAGLTEELEDTAANYRRHQKASDRFSLLVDDVALTTRRLAEQAEEFAIEDDLGDRRASSQYGF
ncbi:MAG: type III secretion system stalk subunit SctO [Geminicoccaceae bacterium]